MFEWSVKRRTGQLVLDLGLSVTASIQEFFFLEDARQRTLRELISLRWQRFGYRNVAVTSAELDLATSLLLGDKRSSNVIREAEHLATIASKYFASRGMQLKQARAEQLLGVAKMALFEPKTALKHFELAESLYEKVRPLSHEHVANLRRMAEALVFEGRLVEAENARNLAMVYSGILMRQSVRTRF